MSEALLFVLLILPFQTLCLFSVLLNTVSKQQTHALHCDGENAECGSHLNKELHGVVGIQPWLYYCNDNPLMAGEVHRSLVVGSIEF